MVHAVPNYVASATAVHSQRPRHGRHRAAGPACNGTSPARSGSACRAHGTTRSRAGNPGGGGVTVAVLDTGVAYRTSRDRRYLRAPDLDRSRFVRGYDFIRNNDLPYDRNGHGTFVAGVIAQSTNNGIGVAGRRLPRAHHAGARARLRGQGRRGARSRAGSGWRPAAARKRDQHELRVRHRAHGSSEIPDVLSAVRFAHRKGAVMVAAAGNTEDTRVAYPARAQAA